MKASQFDLYTACTMAATLLAGCGSPLAGGTPLAAGPPVQNATSTALVYAGTSVYDLSSGKLVGSLSGFDQYFQPLGLCSDASGDVWVAGQLVKDGALYGGEVYEFAHGAMTPTAQLDEKYGAVGCAVDPSTGDVALSNLTSSHPGITGSVAIFLKGQGKPVIYETPQQRGFSFCAYDASGNLFISTRIGTLVELAKGAKTFSNVTLTNNPYVHSLQWYGGALNASSFVPHRPGPTYLLKLKIVKGVATVEHTTTLLQSKVRNDQPSWGEFWIDGGIVVGTGHAGVALRVWKYPAGGLPARALSNVRQWFGVTISR